MLILIIAAKGCFWVLEQPGTSVMELHPLFQALRLLLGVVKKTINTSSFGAPTKKRTLLYSSNFAVKKVSIFFEGLCSNRENAGDATMSVTIIDHVYNVHYAPKTHEPTT